MSRNTSDTSLRVFKSIEHYGLNISRAALVGGASISPYLGAFKTDLFLSANENDVQEAINANIFFDDQKAHTDLASELVPSARVPYKK